MGAMAPASQITSITIVYSIDRLFRRRSKKTYFLVTGLCAGNSPVIGKFPVQMASNAENVSISWRHNVSSLMSIFNDEKLLGEIFGCNFNPVNNFVATSLIEIDEFHKWGHS